MEKLILILQRILIEKNSINSLKLIREFQYIVRNDTNYTVSDPSFEIFNELAHDLEYYEPDYIKRKESHSFYGTKRMRKEIVKSLEKVKKLIS